MLFLMETGILKISNSLFWSTMYWLPVNHLVPCWLFTKLCQMFPGILCCSMSPLWVEQNDPARVNMSSTVFPPPDIDWAHTHTHVLHWDQHRAREEGPLAALRASCRSLRAGSFLSLNPPFSTGLITPWESRPGRQAKHHRPLWPALKWRPLPSAGVNSNQVLFRFLV